MATTLTDAEGNYVFYDVVPGEYTVSETDPDDLISVSDVDGDDNTNNAVDVSIGGSSPLNSTGNDFVDEKQEFGQIGFHLW